MEDNFFEGMTAERFASFQGILRSLKAQHLLWLTNPAQIQCKDPRQAAVIGVARTVRSEASNRFCTLEIDQAEANFVDLVLDVFQKIRRADDDGDRLAADKEYAVHNGVIHVGRYRPFSLTKELAGGPLATTPVEDKVNGVPKQLPAGNSSPPETPEQLESRQQPPDTPVPAGHIEIELRAIGNHELNGHLTPDFHVPASGVVTRVSTDDTIPIHLHPGDHVVVPLTSPSAAKEDNKHPAVGTRVLLPTAGLTLPVRIPPEGHGPTSITHEHAAAMTYPFVTAIHALRNMARLQKGMSVLVHSAALSHRGGDGGVALAALQVCKAVGAETFVTVRGDGGDGVSEEVLQLLEGLGVPRTRVFSAGSFHDGVMRETGGVGVDVVLDLTLTTSDGEPEVRELLWRCVAECGILVELGGAGKVDVCRPPLANRSYCLVDIAQFVKGRPERMER
jgi:NADPH:quinone reductase-like Zn-dependent oxidoreductase